MNEPREKVLNLVASGKISASEGQLLLGALKPARSRLGTWLFTPFQVATPAQVWATALLVCAGSLALSPLRVHFDGAIDLHVLDAAAAWPAALLAQAVAWPLPALVFWLLGLLSRQRAPLLELLGFVGAARLPHLLAALAVAAIRAATRGAAGGAAAVLIVVLVLPLVIWTCWLLYHALRTASGAQGIKLTLTYFAALVLAEVTSKMVLGAWS